MGCYLADHRRAPGEGYRVRVRVRVKAILTVAILTTATLTMAGPRPGAAGWRDGPITARARAGTPRGGTRRFGPYRRAGQIAVLPA